MFMHGYINYDQNTDIDNINWLIIQHEFIGWSI